MDQYFTANDITNPVKMRAILLSFCQSSTYKLIRSLVAPDKPTERSYSELVTLVGEHYHPKPSTTVQRFKFNSRVRQTGESISTFVAALRQLTEHCEFGPLLEDMLSDRLVCGVGDERIQRRLLAEPSLTFKKAFELSTVDTDTDAQDLQLKPRPNANVHAIQKSVTPPHASAPLGRCDRCGGEHRKSDCHFAEVVYHSCGKKGHHSRVCRSKGKPQKSQKPKQGGK